MNKAAYIAVDIGNSRLKFSDGKSKLNVGSDEIDSASLRNYLQERSSHYIVYSSVNKKSKKQLQERFHKRIFVNVHDLLYPVPAIIKSIRSKGTGDDRILGMIGALGFFDAPIVTVDFGTATTINILSKDKEFLGGQIMPGIHTQLKSLSSMTSALPLVEAKGATPLIATETQDAIRSGVLRGTCSAVVESVSELRQQQAFRRLSVVVTGGNAPYILSLLRKKIKLRYVDDLVLRGILTVARSQGIESGV